MNEKTPAPSSKRSPGEQLSFIWKNVERIATCMMTTSDGGRFRSRPMRGVARSQENAIVFITERSTRKPEEIEANPNASLCFVDVTSNTFISLSGVIAVTSDQEKLRELWTRANDSYFPLGPTDPNAVLLTFTPESGEYWDAPSNPVLIAIEFIRASVVGDKPVLGDNAEVPMRSPSLDPDR
jgi:general stress protein 26